MENLRRGGIDWARGSCIGRGSFGTVDMAVNKSNGRVFAVKSVNLGSCLAAQSEALENEIKILKSISSPWVVEYLSDDVTTEHGATSFRNLHMEYMPGGTAADVANDGKILQSRVYCVVAGMKQVHSAGIVHCDIKGRNVLIGSSPGVAKLTDFGSAISVSLATVPSTTERFVPRGSPFWMAPEVVRGEYQGLESDVWSLGCTVIEMVTGRPPWEDSGPDSLLRIGYSEELPELPTHISELGKDFLSKCLCRDWRERWSCDQLLRHPFVSSSEPLNPITHSSPRCVLDWTTSEFSDNEDEIEHCNLDSVFVTESVRDKIGKLASNSGAIWESEGWMEVRNSMGDKEVGTSLEYVDYSRSEVEIYISTESVNLEVIDSGNSAEVATVDRCDDRRVSRTELNSIIGHKSLIACWNILSVIVLILTTIICTLIWVTIMEILKLLFRVFNLAMCLSF